MITKKGYDCLDAATCHHEGEHLFSIWRNTETKEVLALRHRRDNLSETLAIKLRGKSSVKNSIYKVLPDQLKTLEVEKETKYFSQSHFIIKVTDPITKESKKLNLELRHFYQEFVAVKEFNGSLVLCFVCFEDEQFLAPIGVTLVVLNSELKMVNERTHLLGKMEISSFYNGTIDQFYRPIMVNYFCASANETDIGVLLEENSADPWLFNFSLDTLDLTNAMKLVPQKGGFGYIRKMSYRDGDSTVNLLSGNWTIFEIDLSTGMEVGCEQYELTAEKIPYVLYWDKKWIAGGNYGRLGKLQNNAVDFILSLISEEQI